MNDSHLDGKERFMKNEDIFLFTCLFFFGELSYFVKKYLLSLPHCTQTFAVVWCAFAMTSLYKVSIQVGLNTCKCFPPKSAPHQRKTDVPMQERSLMPVPLVASTPHAPLPMADEQGSSGSSAEM